MSRRDPESRIATAILGRFTPAKRVALATALALALVAWWGPPPAAAAAGPSLSASSAILVEPDTGQRLFGVSADRPGAIASTTKLMTALISLEHTHPGQFFTQNNYVPASYDSQIGLSPGERMSVHDLLIALMLPSADDAAEDLAFNVGGGSVGRFVGMMNVRARQLGLTHTHYATPSGLDTPGNYSSAADLVKLAAFLLDHHPFMARVVALPEAVLHSGSQVRVVSNRNVLVGRYPWINGVKTGHTLQAGFVLVASAARGRTRLLSAVLGTDSEASRDENTLALLRYGFSAFRLVTPVKAGAVLARPPVSDVPGAHGQLVALSSFSWAVPRRAHVSLRLQAPDHLTGPLPRHAREGSVQVLVDGRVVKRIGLQLAQAVPGPGVLKLVLRFLGRGTTLLVLGLLLVVALVSIRALRGRERDAKRRRTVEA